MNRTDTEASPTMRLDAAPAGGGPPRVDFPPLPGRRHPDSHDGDLSVRAAWLQFVGGYSQSEISGMLGVSRVKVNRLIAEAQRAGRVRFFVDGGADDCIALENALRERFDLAGCDVVPNISTMDPPLDVLGPAGARLVLRVVEDPTVSLIGVGTGRTLSAVADSLPRIVRPDLDFVSLLGSFRRSTAIDPYDVVHLLASKVAGRCFALPLPFVLDTPELKAVMLSQAFVRQILEMMEHASVKLVGVGSLTPQAHLLEIGMLTPEELAGAEASGAVAEVAGQFFDADGHLVESELDARFVGHSAENLKRGRTVIVAGGSTKVEALRSALQAGFCSHLVVDEWTAARVLGQR